MAQQTAVEWIEERFKETYDREGKIPLAYTLSLVEQAKVMEKEQAKKDFISGMEFIPVDPNRYEEDAEQYYNKTYNK